MKKYMVVMMFEGEQSAFFTDDLNKAENARQNTECGMGGLAEVYERVSNAEEGNSYQLLYS